MGKQLEDIALTTRHAGLHLLRVPKPLLVGASAIVKAVPIPVSVSVVAFSAWLVAPEFAKLTHLDVVPTEAVAATTSDRSPGSAPERPAITYAPPVAAALGQFSSGNNSGSVSGSNGATGAGQAFRRAPDLQTAPGSSRPDLAEREEGQHEAPRAFGGNQMPQRMMPGGFGGGFFGGGWRQGGFGGGFGRFGGMMGGGRRR